MHTCECTYARVTRDLVCTLGGVATVADRRGTGADEPTEAEAAEKAWGEPDLACGLEVIQSVLTLGQTWQKKS